MMFEDDDIEHPHEECGVFAIYAPERDVARAAYFGLFALQHRGQESAGIAVADGKAIHAFKEMGLVNQVFDEQVIASLKGHIAIGHTRYSTTGGSMICNAQPLLATDEQLGQFALAHNGNLANASALRARLIRMGQQFESTSDSEIISAMILRAAGSTLAERVTNVVPFLSAAYSLVLCSSAEVVAVRDPYAVRPLCLGRIDDSWIIASETCALDILGGQFVRDIAPGEMIVIDGTGESGLHSFRAAEPMQPAGCLFEHIYFSRPDSHLGAGSLYSARQRMGVALANEFKVDADLVIAVPDSAIPAATGYATARGIPYADGLIKNRYVGRTFIQPDQQLRERGVRLKFNALPDILRGKRVIMIDDSIVRGTTTRQLVQLLRQAGATEVHVGVTSPPFRHPCYLGIDVAQYNELIAAQHQGDVSKITQAIAADSLHYLSLDVLIEATGLPKNSFCVGCFTGNYPAPIVEDEEQLPILLQNN